MGWAADAGHAAVCKVLFEVDKDLEWREELGRTALALACCQGREQVLRVLLTNGADPNAVDHVGLLPAHMVILASKSFNEYQGRLVSMDTRHF